MSTGSHEPPRTPTATELVGLYTRTLVAYLLAVILLWAVGIEAIYGHPTPFYALHFPAFKSLAVPIAAALTALLVYTLMRKREGGNFALSPGKTGTTPPSSARIQGAFPVYIIPFTAVVLALLLGIALYQDASRNSLEAAIAAFWADYRWHLLAIAVFANGLGALLIYVRRFGWFRDAAGPRETLWWILAVYVFVVAFACAIAMLRNGPEGIAQAYSRQAYEYIGDIGKTRNIHDLFARYEEIHPYLSMHAKVHPPGPIAVLWIMSYLVTQSPMALSLATILFGSLSVVPLYFWARDLGGTPFARTASLIYALSPSIVIFTATSADILFTPVTIGTLFLFDRALGRVSWRYAVAAGIGFACMSLLKFSLIGIGAYFAFIGLWTLRDRSRLPSVVQTAAVMLAAFLALHLAVYWWSGFNAITTFETARMQFNMDQMHLDEFTPRFPAWAWRLLNPLAWFFFAGLPLSILFIWRLARPAQDLKARFLVFLATLIVLDLLYLARGEGERSALYIIPFLALPAAHLLQQVAEEARSITPIAATLGFLAFQCWLIESYFYTYW